LLQWRELVAREKEEMQIKVDEFDTEREMIKQQYD